jgi:hypothetical protein
MFRFPYSTLAEVTEVWLYSHFTASDLVEGVERNVYQSALSGEVSFQDGTVITLTV